MKRRFWAKLTILTIITLLAMGFVIEVAAESKTVVRVEPSQATLVPGGTTTIWIHVDNAEDLFGYEVHLEFDPALIQVIDGDREESGVQVNHGDVFSLAESFLVSNQVDNERGTILYAITQLAPGEAVSGNGILLSLEVKAKASGISGLQFSSVILASTEGMSLPVESQDGQVIVQEGGSEPSANEEIKETNKTDWGVVAGISGLVIIGLVFAWSFIVKNKKR